MSEHNPMPLHSIQILKGIPYEGRKKKENKFPFETMEVGDAFFTESKSVSGHASTAGKKLGFVFTTQGKYVHEGKTGTMVWRLS